MSELTQRGPSRRLFFRVLARSLSVKRPQAVLAMVSLAIGSAILSMLVSIYSDARRKMTQEFRAYGPNILLTPALSPVAGGEALGARGRGIGGVMADSVLTTLGSFRSNLRAVGLLYAVAQLRKLAPDGRSPESLNAVAAGVDFSALRQLYPSWKVQGGASGIDPGSCVAGNAVALRLHLSIGDRLEVVPASAGRPQGAVASLPPGRRQPCQLAAVVTTGTSEDDQIFLPLPALQKLTRLEGKISVVELSASGEAEEITQALRELSRSFPGLDVRPVREIVYSEGKVLGTLRWLMVSLTGLILATAALAVAATVIAIVIERRKDIAVMKALGASNRAVMQLFLAEAAGLGLAGGAAGSLLGGFLAGRIGDRIFQTSLQWVGWAVPMVCLFSMVLAGVAAAFPVQIIRAIEPATMLKGE